MFFWRASTFLAALETFLPATHAALLRLAETIGTPRYTAALKRTYAKLANISVDYAILEPATRDARRRASLRDPGRSGLERHRLLGRRVRTAGHKVRRKRFRRPHFALDATGNFLWSPGKFIAAIGVRDLVVVETPDALLLCPRDRAQDVGKIVKWLEARKLRQLL